MTLRRAIFIGVSLLWVHISYALTEGEFIEHILSNSQYFAKDKIYLDIKQTELDYSQKSYSEWQTDLTLNHTNTRYKIDKDTTSTRIYNQGYSYVYQQLALDVEKNFIDHPGKITARFSRTLPNNDITRYKQDTYYSSWEEDLSNSYYRITYSYPFLKHHSNAESLKTYKRNILDLQSEELDYLDAQEDTLVDKLEEFLEIASLNEQIKVYNVYLKELEHLNTENEDKINSEIEVTKKTIQKLTSNRTANVQELTLSIPKPLNFQNVSLNFSKQAVLVDDIRAELRTYNRDLLRYDIDRKLKKIDIAYYENQTLPDLDLTFTAEREDAQGNTLTTKYDNRAHSYTSSLVFSMPLGGDTSDDGNVIIANLNLDKINYDYNSKLSDLIAEVSALDTSLTLDKQLIDEYPKTLDSLVKSINTLQSQDASLAELLLALKRKRDTLLEYVEVVERYQLNILEYEDLLDRIVR